jgi:hypothetical protein
VSLITFPSPRAGALTDDRLRTILAAQVALQIALDGAYSDLRGGAPYIGTSLRLAEDGSGVVQEVATRCRSTFT